MSLPIKGYLKTSLIEWPGKISATVFLPTCNFRCPFCHNADLVLNHVLLETIDQEHVLKDLKSRKEWIDGVVVTGGEPTLHPELSSFLGKIQKLEMKTMIHTNGTHPDIISDLINSRVLDYVSMDIKAPLDHRYRNVAGVEVDLEKVRSSIDLIKNSKIEYEFRTTVVPLILTKEDVVDVAKEIPWAQEWYLQQFIPKNTIDQEYLKVKPYSGQEMNEILKAAQKHAPKAKLRGVD